MTDIFTLTMNPAIDKSTTVKRVAPNRKLRCGPPRREPGGGGLNVSRALERLGGDSVALYLAGGPTGRILGELLEEEGLTCAPMDMEGWTRENLTVREEEEENAQYRFSMQGPEVAEDEWKACLEALTEFDPPPKYLVASGSLPPGVPADFYARAAVIARDRQIRFILDTSGDALKEGLEEGVFLVKPNLRELGALTGMSVAEEESDFEEKQAEGAREILERGGAEAVMVSMGSAGALLVARDETRRIPSPTVRIRSRVGAGDSMVAGVVLGLTRDFPLSKAALFGVAAGAAAVMTPGTELCRRRDAEALFRRMVETSDSS
jgi:6-phosphofructokinase 2